MGLQLTRSGEHALRAMVYLATRPAGELSSLIDVSREQQLSQFSLAKILQQLGHAGLLLSRRGQRGGFALARSASQITVAEVVQASEGALSLNRCVPHPESCERSEACTVRTVWMRAQEGLMSVLEQVTIADLTTGEEAWVRGGDFGPTADGAQPTSGPGREGNPASRPEKLDHKIRRRPA